MRHAILIFGLLFLSAAALSQITQAATQPSITVTIGSDHRQQFFGFGTSLTNDQNRFQDLSPASQSAISKMVWQDLNFKIMRLWFNPTHYIADPNHPDLTEFKNDYVASNIISLATKQGCTTLLLAPNDVPAQFAKSTPPASGYVEFTDVGVKAYAALLATAIKQMRDELGVNINATGVLNEPNDRPVRFTLGQWPVMIQSFRAELDARGLTNVQIISPEAASCDDTAYGMVDAIKYVPAAWKCLNGIATHTYNMGATDDMISRIAGEAKSYWQTESSTPGPENLGDNVNAATSAARIISDLNHGVTHWIWFIGYEQNDPNDNGTRLIRYDATNPNDTGAKFYKYWYIQQLSQAFPPGTTLHPCTSSIEDTMTWTYGMKPTLLTAAGVRPDGTWAIAVQNFTSNAFTSSTLSAWDRSQSGQSGRTITTLVKMSSLVNTAGTVFHVRRSNSTMTNVDAGTVTAMNGIVTLTLAPLELVTLTAGDVASTPPPVVIPPPPIVVPPPVVTPPTTQPTTPPPVIVPPVTTPPVVTPPPTKPPKKPPTTAPTQRRWWWRR